MCGRVGADAGGTVDGMWGRLASRTPRCEVHPQANSYLDVLDRVLLDRQISRHEEDELIAVAESIGLSREDAIALHRLYLTALAHSAQSDGMVVLPSNGFDGGHPATLQKCR